VESISISLDTQTLESITSEAEIQDFDSRSAYIRHIIQSRGQIESIDQTEVDVIEEVAQRLSENHHDEISELEEQINNVKRHLGSLDEMIETHQKRYNYTKQMEDSISELESTVDSNVDQLSNYARENRSQQREIRDNEEEIEYLKNQIHSLKSDIREVRESNADSQ
jgi:chromosome segregation ATPase